MINEHKHT